MTLVTHQIQGFYTTFPLRPLTWSKGLKLKQRKPPSQAFRRTDWCFCVKRNLRLSVGSYNRGPKTELLRISAFKGNAQNDESGARANGSKVKNPAKISYPPKGSEETTMESPKAQAVPFTYTTGADDKFTGSPAIRSLFKKWLSMLRTQSPSQVADGILEEGSRAGEELSQSKSISHNEEGILKAIWCLFLGLDATIKVPLLMFIPLYLVVSVIYGAEVSKELTPLWILGPLIVALYVKMLHGLWGLYVFSFTQTVKVIKNLPTFYMVAYSYITQGKLKTDVHARLVQPVVNVKNTDYKELAKQKMKKLEEWVVEKYLDYVESIWPYYCRVIRFLKKANLI